MKFAFAPTSTLPSLTLPLVVTRLEGSPHARLRLASRSGAAVLELGDAQHFVVFSHGQVRLGSAGGTAGRAFVDDVARWLGMALGEETTGEPQATSIHCRWVRVQGEDEALVRGWIPFKLELVLGIRAAEVFLLVSTDLTRAELVESVSSNRQSLLEILERSLTGLPPRVVKQIPLPTRQQGGAAFQLHGFVQFHIPEGWRLTRRPEGHFRLADAEDEMMLELSAARLPFLPLEAPSVPEQLQQVMQASPYALATEPFVTFERAGASFAWSQYAFDARDSKRPGDPERPAFGRTLIASNAWVHVIVTGCCWQTDLAAFARTWDEVVRSLDLAIGIEPPPDVIGNA